MGKCDQSADDLVRLGKFHEIPLAHNIILVI